ncbi:MAG: hypothetical protein L6Q95_13445 [Planctomycetes bacterium]|nr:hypothetical protein [Planctomycetota bacterium]
MTEERIIFRGRRVPPSWPATLEAAQARKTTVVDGIAYERVRFGDEEDDWGADRGPCHDCAAVKGEFHVPGCDVERCPACAGQAIGCDCERASEDG